MKVSVVICTYSEDMYEHFQECLESIQAQTYDDIEIIVIVDGNDQLFERIESEYGDHSELKIHCNDENLGLSGSRNRALEFVTGDIVALIDDDAVADERWIEELVEVYETTDAIAAGGKINPLWVAGKPQFLPEEFYWLVGVTHRGFADHGEEVRNTNGSNISFKTEVLEELDGFQRQIGRQGEKNLQAEETELCLRMQQKYGKGVVYNEKAEVGHKVFEYRTDKRWLLNRSFWQGYSKRALEKMISGGSTREESEYLKNLFFTYVPLRIKSLVVSPSLPKMLQLLTIILFTATVGTGYLWGVVKW